MIDTRPLRLRELRSERASHGELRSALTLRYGRDLGHLRFRLIEVPLAVLRDYRLDDFDAHFESLIESDREYDAIMLRCGEEPDWPWEDAEERYLIARAYRDAYRARLRVLPIVADFESMAEFKVVDVIDGHHRVLAAHEAGAAVIRAYEVF